MSQETELCTECQSEYFKNSSEMPKMCPDCSHKLYGYENCSHEFDNGRCAKCYWNGKTSEFLKSRMD